MAEETSRERQLRRNVEISNERQAKRNAREEKIRKYWEWRNGLNDRETLEAMWVSIDDIHKKLNHILERVNAPRL